jgi:cysteinyl-tRNA synthetase
MGQPGPVDEDAVNDFQSRINYDLNMPRALALAWDVVKSDLPAATKKRTLLEFDKVLGLRLADWEPDTEKIPIEIQALVDQRQEARLEKRWQEADELRDEIAAAGYEVEDTAEGPRVRSSRSST